LKKEQLNKLVSDYRESRCESVFNEIYAELVAPVHKKNVKIAQSLGITPEEVIEISEDVLMKCLEDYEGKSNFENYFNASVRRKRIDYAKRGTAIDRTAIHIESLKKSNDESEAATWDIADGFNLEETVIQTKEADQRQLVDFLTKDSDATTKAIVEAFRRRPNSSALAIEKDLGLRRHTVKRKLEMLAGNFSTKQYGDYPDYLVAL